MPIHLRLLPQVPNEVSLASLGILADLQSTIQCPLFGVYF